jgi:hypothetical protein
VAEDDLEAIGIYRFHKQNPQGYNFTNHFKVENAETLDGLPLKILNHQKSKLIIPICLMSFTP